MSGAGTAGGKPVLVVQGLDGGITPPESGRDLEGLYPDRVTLVEIEATGHALLPEQPAVIAKNLTGWLHRFSRDRAT